MKFEMIGGPLDGDMIVLPSGAECHIVTLEEPTTVDVFGSDVPFVSGELRKGMYLRDDRHARMTWQGEID